MTKKLFMANWKMNHTNKDAQAFVDVFAAKTWLADTEVAICAPFTVLHTLQKGLKNSACALGAENFYPAAQGAFTGEINLEMLKEFDITYVLVGHSERRDILGEDDALVTEKYWQAIKEDITPVLCVGESEAVRNSGQAEKFCEGQLRAVFAQRPTSLAQKDVIIAYEPIWAIGTGKTATVEDAEAMCAHLHQVLMYLLENEKPRSLRILYGGSVKTENVADFMKQAHIDGALVGGASLKAESFADLIAEGSGAHG